MTVETNATAMKKSSIRFGSFFLFDRQKHQLPRKLGPRLFQLQGAVGFFTFVVGFLCFFCAAGYLSVGSMLCRF